MKNKESGSILLIALAILLIFGIIFVGQKMLSTHYKDGRPLVRLEGYNHIEPGEAACKALSPQCGYCPGVEIKKECWVENK